MKDSDTNHEPINHPNQPVEPMNEPAVCSDCGEPALLSCSRCKHRGSCTAAVVGTKIGASSTAAAQRRAFDDYWLARDGTFGGLRKLRFADLRALLHEEVGSTQGVHAAEAEEL